LSHSVALVSRYYSCCSEQIALFISQQLEIVCRGQMSTEYRGPRI